MSRQAKQCLSVHAAEYETVSNLLISLLCNIEAIEHIRAAVCAAKEYERELSADS
jgi:hypothetical protein